MSTSQEKASKKKESKFQYVCGDRVRGKSIHEQDLNLSIST